MVLPMIKTLILFILDQSIQLIMTSDLVTKPNGGHDCRLRFFYIRSGFRTDILPQSVWDSVMVGNVIHS